MIYTAQWSIQYDWNGEPVSVFRLFQDGELIISFNPAVDDEPVKALAPVDQDAEAEMIRRHNLQLDEAILGAYHLMKG